MILQVNGIGFDAGKLASQLVEKVYSIETCLDKQPYPRDGLAWVVELVS